MKLICPRCGAGIRIGWQTRYQLFSCSSCDLPFFGLEAHTSWGSFLLDDPSKTPCPHCWQYVRLMADLQNGGWYGPPRCSSCLEELPERPEIPWQQREAQAKQVQRELREERERKVATPQPRSEKPKPKQDTPAASGPAPAPADEAWWQGMKCHFCGSPMFPRSAEPNFPRCPNAPGNQMYCN